MRSSFTESNRSLRISSCCGWWLAAALVVALAVFGWSSYTKRQTAKASAALDDAMKIFQARIRAPGEQAEPGEITYVDEKNKFADAEKKFLEVANQYGRTSRGRSRDITRLSRKSS